MRSITSTAFETVAALGDNLQRLELNPKTGIYETPYTPIQMNSFNSNVDGLVMYRTEDIAFVNTSEFTKTGREFIRTGKYTKADPVYDRAEFDAFWDEEQRRCIEGYTVPGKLIQENGVYKLQEVHITGEHYGYLNFGEIKRSKGFEINKGALVGPSGEPLKAFHQGGVKDFFFPDFWDGDYYFFKAVELCRQIGRHLVVGKARRKGYSYKNGWIVANRANLYRRSTSVVGAYDAASLFDDGTMVKVLNYLDFINKHTDWNKRRLHNTLEHIEIGFRYKGDDTKHGFLSNIYTSILKGNPGGMRGKDADLLLLEESGKCPNLSEILDATLKTLSDGIYTTGLFIAFGTGGGDDNQWQGFEDLFYDTHARQFVSFENVWDDDMSDTGCGFFHGSFMSKPGLIDIHGNSDIQGSIAFDNAEKALVSHDPAKLNAHEMEEPSKPSQAFSRAGNNLFPSKQLDEQLRRCMHDPTLQGIGREGIFIRMDGEVKFVDRKTTNLDSVVIPPLVDNYPLDAKDNVAGCWVLYGMPYRNKTSGIPDDLYSLWNDPYGISKEKEFFKANKDSLACTILYENPNNFTPTMGDRLVGMFVGRREDTADYDEQMFLAAEYFNGKILYENDRGDVYSNAKALNCLDLLKEEPGFQYQKELARGGMGRKRGISIAGNSARKTNGVLYLKKWLLEKRGVDANGKDILNLHYIYNIGLLKELLKYDGKRNADRVSACIVGMFDIRETLHRGTLPDNSDINPIEDEYFKNPYSQN